MRVAITGASGFIGSNLTRLFRENGNSVFEIKRSILYDDFDKLVDHIENSDIVIHLSGAPIMQRWTRRNRDIIRKSRLESGKRLYMALEKASSRPGLVFLSSGKDIYNIYGTHDETSRNFRGGFLEELITEWEGFAVRISKLGIRTIVMRLGIILGSNGGALKSIAIPFKLGLGGRMGNGKQIMSFMHVEDVYNAIILLTEKSEYSGVVNFVSTDIVTNAEFSKMLARILKRPCGFKIPAFLLRLIFGEASVLLTEGPKVVPGVLVESGFTYKYNSLDNALEAALIK